MLESAVTIVHIILKFAGFVILSKIAWQLWWNRPGADGRDIPGDMGWPIIGESVSFFSQTPRMFARRKHALYGPVFKSHILGRPHVFLESSEDIKKCLLGDERIVMSQLPRSLQVLMGQDSILGQHGDKHYENRSLLLQCLTTPCLQSLLKIIGPHMESMIRSWIEQSYGLDPVNITPDIIKIVFILSQTLVYGDFDLFTNERIENLLHTMDAGSISLPLDLPFTAFGKALAAKRKLRAELLKDVIAREQHLSGTNLEPRAGYLDMLLDQRRQNGVVNDPNYDQLISQLTLALSAPTLTTSSGIFLMLNFLARNEELVERLRQEQSDVVQDCNDALEICVIKSLPLLDSAVREILRRFPVAMMLHRVTIKSFETENGLEIPAGWDLSLDLDSCMTHYSKIIDVDQFMAERFLKDTDKSYQPNQFECNFFGAGARRCPGQDIALLTIKMFLILLIRRCNFCYPANYQMIIKDIPVPLPSYITPISLIFKSRL